MSAATAMLRSEGKLMLRNPGVIVWAAVLPVAAAIVLGAIPATREPTEAMGGLSFFAIYQPILVLFAVSILAVQALPDVLTRYRELGVLKRLRTTPASPALLLNAQLLLVFGISVVCAVLMIAIPPIFGAPWPENIAGFALAFVLTSASMMGIGMVIASLFRNAKVAAGFGTLLFFVLQFFAGMWLQRPLMPDWMRVLSDYTPSGAGSQALVDTANGGWPSLLHLVVLVVWGVLTALAAIRLFKWE